MRVGILGSGLMGAKLGTLFARAGHEVTFSYARSQEKLNHLAREAGAKARAGTPREAAEGADALLLAVHWSCIDDVLKQSGDLGDKVIVSCSLPLNAANTELVLGHTTSGAEALAKKLPGTEVVSAFNNIPSEVLFGVFEARGTATPPSMVYCGDNQAAKGLAGTLIRDVGFEPIDAGPLRIARYTDRSRSSSPNSRMAVKPDRNWHTGSSGLGPKPGWLGRFDVSASFCVNHAENSSIVLRCAENCPSTSRAGGFTRGSFGGGAIHH